MRQQKGGALGGLVKTSSTRPSVAIASMFRWVLAGGQELIAGVGFLCVSNDTGLNLCDGERWSVNDAVQA